jgi:hypothetical protein
MSLKSKIISIILLLILVVPVVGIPLSQSNGKVLGASEDKRVTTSLNKGEIAGGVIDNKKATSTAVKTISGLAALDENATFSTLNNKYQFGSNLEVTSNSKSLQIPTVLSSSTLPDNTVLSLDKEKFVQLGGDLTTKKPINVSVLSK